VKPIIFLSGASVAQWKPFPDSIDALVRLQKHYKMVILSNVDKTSFAGTAQVLSPFVPDLVLTAQEIGSYKPNEQNFRYMLAVIAKEFGLKPNEVLITAQSLVHDHQPAHALGLKGAWIAREGSVMGVGELVKDVKYEFVFPTLGEMAAAVESCE
jgi:2-haloalkanoic acid dehalogenase type II